MSRVGRTGPADLGMLFQESRSAGHGLAASRRRFPVLRGDAAPVRGTTRSSARSAGSGRFSCSEGPGRTGLAFPDKQSSAPVFPCILDAAAPTGEKNSNKKKNPSAGGFEKLERASWAKERNIPGKSGNIQGETQPGWKTSRDLPDGIQNQDLAAPGVHSSHSLSREFPGGSSPFPASLEGFPWGQSPRWSSGPNSWPRALRSSWKGWNS